MSCQLFLQSQMKGYSKKNFFYIVKFRNASFEIGFYQTIHSTLT